MAYRLIPERLKPCVGRAEWSEAQVTARGTYVKRPRGTKPRNGSEMRRYQPTNERSQTGLPKVSSTDLSHPAGPERVQSCDLKHTAFKGASQPGQVFAQWADLQCIAAKALSPGLGVIEATERIWSFGGFAFAAGARRHGHRILNTAYGSQST
jgi:hypothetical protein